MIWHEARLHRLKIVPWNVNHVTQHVPATVYSKRCICCTTNSQSAAFVPTKPWGHFDPVCQRKVDSFLTGTLLFDCPVRWKNYVVNQTNLPRIKAYCLPQSAFDGGSFLNLWMLIIYECTEGKPCRHVVISAWEWFTSRTRIKPIDTAATHPTNSYN